MKKGISKVYYLGFIFALLYSAAAIAITISIYISMIQSPGGIELQLIRISLPIIVFIIIFFDLRLKYRRLIARRRVNQAQNLKEKV